MASCPADAIKNDAPGTRRPPARFSSTRHVRRRRIRPGGAPADAGDDRVLRGARQGALKDDDHERRWYADFLDFVARERIFATMLTPAGDGGGDAERWDTWRICEFTEILGFYGLAYWYTWQVSILGLGPIWMSANEAARAARRASCSRTARSSPSASPRRRTAPTSTRPTWCSTPRRRRRLPRQRRQVLHRQRQRGGDGLDLRPPRRRRGPDDYVFFAADSPAPERTS